MAWGIVHGLLLVLHRGFRHWCEHLPRLRAVLDSLPGTIFRVGLTFLCVTACWVLLRAAGFRVAAAVLHRMAVPVHGAAAPLASVSLVLTLAMLLLCHLFVRYGGWKALSVRLPAPALGVGYAALLMAALTLAPEGAKGFIYCQF